MSNVQEIEVSQTELLILSAIYHWFCTYTAIDCRIPNESLWYETGGMPAVEYNNAIKSLEQKRLIKSDLTRKSLIKNERKFSLTGNGKRACKAIESLAPPMKSIKLLGRPNNSWLWLIWDYLTMQSEKRMDFVAQTVV